MRYRLGQRRSTTRLRSSRRVGLSRHRCAPRKPTAPPRPSSSCLSQSESQPGQGCLPRTNHPCPKPGGEDLQVASLTVKTNLACPAKSEMFLLVARSALFHCSLSWKDGSAAVAHAALFLAAQLRYGRRRISGGRSPAQSLSEDRRGERILQRQEPQSTQCGAARECSIMMLRV